MEDTATIAAARSFLKLIEEGSVPSSRELLRALDGLAMTYHETPEGDPAEGEAEPPRYDYKARCASLGKRFPDYGYYVLSNPSEPITEEGILGNAIDDLAGISDDLQEVIWRFEHFGPEDAHWHFRFLFEIHWGMHLRELSVYLHATALRASEGD
jgi:hypothetical protein